MKAVDCQLRRFVPVDGSASLTARTKSFDRQANRARSDIVTNLRGSLQVIATTRAVASRSRSKELSVNNLNDRILEAITFREFKEYRCVVGMKPDAACRCRAAQFRNLVRAMNGEVAVIEN